MGRAGPRGGGVSRVSFRCGGGFPDAPGGSLTRGYTTTGHLNVLANVNPPPRRLRLRRRCHDLHHMQRDSSGVKSGSFPVAKHSATSDAPCCQTYPSASVARRSNSGRASVATSTPNGSQSYPTSPMLPRTCKSPRYAGSPPSPRVHAD